MKTHYDNPAVLSNRLDVMASKFLPLLFGIGLTFGVAQVQPQLPTGTPTESPSPSKHRTSKETGATASPAGALPHLQQPSRPRLRRNRNVFAEKQRLKCLLAPLQLQSRHRRPQIQNQVPTFVQTEEVAVRQSSRRELSAYKLKWRCDRANATARADVIRALGRRSKIGHQGFARAMAAKPPIPADGPRRDRFFPRALACRRSLAVLSQEELTQSPDHKMVWPWAQVESVSN